MDELIVRLDGAVETLKMLLVSAHRKLSDNEKAMLQLEIILINRTIEGAKSEMK